MRPSRRRWPAKASGATAAARRPRAASSTRTGSSRPRCLWVHGSKVTKTSSFRIWSCARMSSPIVASVGYPRMDRRSRRRCPLRWPDISVRNCSASRSPSTPGTGHSAAVAGTVARDRHRRVETPTHAASDRRPGRLPDRSARGTARRSDGHRLADGGRHGSTP